MPIAKTISRPKLSTTVNYNVSLLDKPVTVSGDDIFLRVTLDNLAVDPVTITGCTTTNASATVSVPAEAIANARIGDAVTGTGIAANTKVTAVNLGNNTITLNNAATAAGTVNLTFTSPAVDGTVYVVKLSHAIGGSGVTVTPTLYVFDGSKVSDKSGTGDDSAIATDATQTYNLTAVQIDVDGFLNKARVNRTNS